MSRAEGLKAGFVLHQRPYRETSALTDLFTESDGRVTVVARGVRGSQRRGRQNNISPFRAYLLDWKGRGELPTLSTAEPVSPPHDLAGDALFAGLYANELLLRLCTLHDPHPVVYTAYLKLMLQLEHDVQNIDIALRYFERDLLLELGYGLSLEFDSISGDEIDSGRRYGYQPERGVYQLPESAIEAGNGYSGATLLALAHGELEGQVQRQEARRLLRLVLGQVLGNRPLKSLETLKRMKQIGHADKYRSEIHE